MVNLNRILLIGNLTRDPELRYTPSGTAVTNMRLAVNSSYKSQTGERKEETCFVTVVAWGRQAETCNQYLQKGRPVFVEGRLISRSWEAEGKTRSVMEVRADRVQFLGGSGKSGTSELRTSGETADHAEPAMDAQANADFGAEVGESFNNDEVPF